MKSCVCKMRNERSLAPIVRGVGLLHTSPRPLSRHLASPGRAFLRPTLSTPAATQGLKDYFHCYIGFKEQNLETAHRRMAIESIGIRGTDGGSTVTCVKVKTTETKQHGNNSRSPLSVLRATHAMHDGWAHVDGGETTCT